MMLINPHAHMPRWNDLGHSQLTFGLAVPGMCQLHNQYLTDRDEKVDVTEHTTMALGWNYLLIAHNSNPSGKCGREDVIIRHHTEIVWAYESDTETLLVREKMYQYLMTFIIDSRGFSFTPSQPTATPTSSSIERKFLALRVKTNRPNQFADPIIPNYCCNQSVFVRIYIYTNHAVNKVSHNKNFQQENNINFNSHNITMDNT